MGYLGATDFVISSLDELWIMRNSIYKAGVDHGDHAYY